MSTNPRVSQRYNFTHSLVVACACVSVSVEMRTLNMLSGRRVDENVGLM
jgi:hypothetical protein